MEIFVNIVIVLLLVFMNGFFVAAEFAIVKVRKSRIETLVTSGDAAAKHTKKVIDDLNSYLSACQLGITLASLGLGWVGEPTVAKMLTPVLSYFNLPAITVHAISFIVGFSVITTLHIVLGELVPKTLSIISAEKISLLTSRPLIGFYKLTYPVIWLFNATTALILKMFGLNMAGEHEDVHTDDELKLLMEDSYKHQMIDQTEYSFIENIFGFSEKTAKEIMTPRTDMICINIENSVEQIEQLLLNEQLTRYPVYEKDKDNIIGFVNIKDLYTQAVLKKETNIRESLREVLFVPEITSLSRLLKMMQFEKSQIAVLVDEYGGTSGLVTTEDILEEIVGNIQDEFDDETEEIQQLETGVYSISGALSIDEVNKLLTLNIEANGIDTIGGWIVSQLESAVGVGGIVNYCDFCFEITEMQMQSLRILRLKVFKTE